MRLENGEKPSGPSWQWRIRAVAYKAIALRQKVWGRRYAAFLRSQADLLDKAFGLSAQRMKAPRRARQERHAIAVGVIVQANPHWTTAEVANAVGIATSAAHRYVKIARERYVEAD